jgi:hypothetical protein
MIEGYGTTSSGSPRLWRYETTSSSRDSPACGRFARGRLCLMNAFSFKLMDRSESSIGVAARAAHVSKCNALHQNCDYLYLTRLDMI